MSLYVIQIIGKQGIRHKYQVVSIFGKISPFPFANKSLKTGLCFQYKPIQQSCFTNFIVIIVSNPLVFETKFCCFKTYLISCLCSKRFAKINNCVCICSGDCSRLTYTITSFSTYLIFKPMKPSISSGSANQKPLFANSRQRIFCCKYHSSKPHLETAVFLTCGGKVSSAAALSSGCLSRSPM